MDGRKYGAREASRVKEDMDRETRRGPTRVANEANLSV